VTSPGVAPPAEEHVCPLCSSRFVKGAVRCGACPMSRVCDLACCPNCGYEFVERSATVDALRRMGAGLKRIFGWAPPDAGEER
jgi:hypothetical protein